MRIALNKEAGMITVNDLHDHTHIEIRDMSGNVLMEVNTITPSFTMESLVAAKLYEVGSARTSMVGRNARLT